MRIGRLLTVLALVAAGLASPAPAAAQQLTRVTQENVTGICAALGGTLIGDRSGIVCQTGDDTVECTLQGCVFQPTRTNLLEDPPFKEPCELVRGTFVLDLRNQIACQLREGTLTLQCFNWWETSTLCDLGWIPSEQPMT